MELLFPLLLLLPLLLLIMRQRKQQRTFSEQQGRVGVGMTVMTTGGLYGTVFDIEDDVVVLEVDEGVYTRWSRLAIGKIIDDPAAAGPETGDGATGFEAEPSEPDESPEPRDPSGAPVHEPSPHQVSTRPAPDQVDIRKGATRPASSQDGV